jgi:hypothetical protein
MQYFAGARISGNHRTRLGSQYSLSMNSRFRITPETPQWRFYFHSAWRNVG